MDILDYQEAASKYAPSETTILFIAESPPYSRERYFYFEDVPTDDWLWIGLMKVLYPVDFMKAKIERPKKPKWLNRFRNDGYMLTDALKEPLCYMSSRKREGLIANRADKIIKEIKEISPKQIVLIKTTVYDELYAPLRDARLPVANARLPFPGSGHQKKFACEFDKAVKDGRIVLSNIDVTNAKDRPRMERTRSE